MANRLICLGSRPTRPTEVGGTLKLKKHSQELLGYHRAAPNYHLLRGAHESMWTLKYLESLQKLGQELRSSPSDLTIAFTRSDPDRPKQSAWLTIEAAELLGQITVWQSGECELEIYDPEAKPLLRHQVQFASPEEVEAALDQLLQGLA